MAKGKFDMSEFLKPAAVSDPDTGREQIIYLPVDQLRADEKNFYSLDGIDELAANIELIGLQQPIRVRKDGGGYVIVSGHRRSAALRLLVKDGQERFREAPCIIEHNGGESAAMRELRLICANSDTRKMSSADISKQLSRMKELIYELSKEGYEFKGKIRDFAAEAIGISRTKAARLQFIESHLAQGFAYLWKKNKLNESTAYELAHFEPDFQQRLARIFKGGKGLPAAENLARLCKTVADGESYEPTMTCPGGKPCTHGDAALRHDACGNSWETKCKAKVCCLKCGQATESYSPCDRMCTAAQKRRAEKNAKEKAKAAAEKEKKLNQNFAELQATCVRMVRAADAAGLSDKAKANDGYMSGGGHEIRLLRRYARGEFKPDETPYFYDFKLEKCSTLVKCAQTLHCTTDYLLGLTDELTPTAKLEAGDLAFADGREMPPRSGEYYCRFDCAGTQLYSVAYWDGMLERWMFGENGAKIEAECLGWYPLPEKIEEEKDYEK